ncbi:TlpA disulfide reductase family protein [Chitinophaga sp. Cy-1792]|uniref:TlpA disulfide reductase family protein n=1 Tax=Chitinophaga sp. Cy-1792 TaxID=2608339 RepID=UPI0014211B90|nr:TlpA disulfide reductase family protein [Chitinophaga sp. Cy-1792]NIG54345.1 AhpC/TSA family protein [Chitinophaga sp. Cy-1792]
MKYFLRLVVLLLAPLVTFADDGFVIKGKVSGIISGSASVQLREEGPDGSMNTVVSPKVKIENGVFTYSGKLDHPQQVILKISTKSFLVFLENVSYTIDGDFSTLTADSLKGGVANAAYLKWKKSELSAKEYLKANRGEVVAPFIARMLAFDYDNTAEVYNLLTAEGKQSYYGKQLKEKLNDYEKVSAGKPMKDFKMTDPSGKPVSMKDFSGKIVVMDFWASWCAPCLAYIPKMREHYNNFKDAGVVFLSVSIDEDVKKWKEAMAAQHMEWGQVVTPGGLSPKEGVTPLFSITSIPHVMIVGKDGMIAANLDFSHKEEIETILKRLTGK